MNRPMYQKWTIVYFCINAIPSLVFCFVPFQDGGFSPDEETTARLIFVSFFVLFTIPVWRITLGKRTPKNYRKLLFWIILETVYNPIFGIPVWIFWVKNKAYYGNEAAFEIEKQKRKIETQKFTAGLRKGATGLILAESALRVLSKGDSDTVVKNTAAATEAAIRVGLLAALNPDKAKKVKDAIKHTIDPASSKTSPAKSVQDRIIELKKLYDNQLITLKEYETKKAEIISQL